MSHVPACLNYPSSSYLFLMFLQLPHFRAPTALSFSVVLFGLLVENFSAPFPMRKIFLENVRRVTEKAKAFDVFAYSLLSVPCITAVLK